MANESVDFRCGIFTDDGKPTWHSIEPTPSGCFSNVAINIFGKVIHEYRNRTDWKCYYRIGQIIVTNNRYSISWAEPVQTPNECAVALNNYNEVIHGWSDLNQIYCRIGIIEGTSITWVTEPAYVCDGAGVELDIGSSGDANDGFENYVGLLCCSSDCPMTYFAGKLMYNEAL